MATRKYFEIRDKPAPLSQLKLLGRSMARTAYAQEAPITCEGH
jgi:hypothetical protein